LAALSVNGPILKAEAVGEVAIDLTHDRLVGHLRVERLDLAAVNATAEQKLLGTASGPIELSGSLSSPTVSGRLQLSGISVQDIPLGDGPADIRLLPDAASVGNKPEQLLLVSARLVGPRGRLRARVGLALQRQVINAVIKLDDTDIEPWLLLAGRDDEGRVLLPYEGTASVLATVQGPFKSPVIKARLDLPELSIRTQPRGEEREGAGHRPVGRLEHRVPGDERDHDHDHGDEGHEHTHDKGDHEHIYTCPMRCKGSQSNEPGKCPKCGMNLEHSDTPLSSKEYRIAFTSTPAQLEAGKSAAFSFTPKEKGNEEAMVPIDIVHEKKIHMMVFSKDLSYFEHIHPEYQPEGDYVISVLGKDDEYSKGRGLKETKFLNGGEYVIFLDYTPTGGSNQLEKIPITVAGNEIPTVPLGNERFVWENNGYQATLSSDKGWVTNTSIELNVNITRNEKPVTDLGQYLAALAHMVILSEDLEEYLHVHPMESETTGPDIKLHTNFPKTGGYKVFMQFNHEGVIHTTNFILNVI